MDKAIENFRSLLLHEKQKQGLTWEDLAFNAEVSLQHVRSFARQKINPTLEYASRVLASLGAGMWIGAASDGEEPKYHSNALSYDELCQMDGDPVWMELVGGKWVCYLIYQQDGEPAALGAAILVTGQLEPVERLLDEGFAFYRCPPKGGR